MLDFCAPACSSGVFTKPAHCFPHGCLYALWHPEYRTEEKLSRIARASIDGFRDRLASQGVLTGRIVEVGCGALTGNRGSLVEMHFGHPFFPRDQFLVNISTLWRRL